MCEVIPKAELRKLEKRFGVEKRSANPSVQLRLKWGGPPPSRPKPSWVLLAEGLTILLVAARAVNILR